MADPLGRQETLDLLRRHGVSLRRRLGQHFLVEPNVVRRIVEVAGCGAGDRVVEVGTGAGTLTRQLAAAGARVITYEIDEALRPVLAETLLGLDGVDVRFGDASLVDFEAELPPGEWTMVANLPYNVGTPLILEALRRARRITRFVVMLQREAVDRFVAEPGTREYGLPSIVVALHGRARIALAVPGHLFVPPTPVESAVAVIDRQQPHPHAERAIELAAVAFAQRRKMLRSSLRGVFADPAADLHAAGIDSTARAGDVSAADYARLAEIS
jgi:16S rRNA (adenine1518-N6/adenine1519-N6)-dimethyltransferase